MSLISVYADLIYICMYGWMDGYVYMYMYVYVYVYVHVYMYIYIYIHMYHIFIYIYIWQFLVCSCTRFPPAPVSTQVFLWSGLCPTRSKASCSGLAQGDALELNPRRKGIRWLSAAPGAAGENFLNHGLKKIEGSEGAILDKNKPFWRYF